MNLSVRVSRRFAAGLSLAAAAILLPTAALASSAASGTQAVRPISACHSPSTFAWLGVPGNGAAGTIYYEIQLSNIGHVACTLQGYPGVSEINFHGNQVGLPASHGGPRPTVTLPPGGTAHFVLVYHEAGANCLHPVAGSELRVFPPNQIHSQLVELALEQCPHKSIMSVDAVHPGAGIPFYSVN